MSSARIIEELRARIESGELKPGARVPSARQIMRKWGVANATAAKALAALADQGLVRARPGVGTVVATREDPGLSLKRVLAVGLSIANREGLAAVSMRRIATELGVATMSLYRYVPNKEELIVQLIDAAFAAAGVPEQTSGAHLRERLEAAARLQWAVYKRFPWLASAISLSRPQLVPHGMHHTERVLSAMDGLSVGAQTRLIAALSLIGFVRGAAVALEMELQAQQETGVSSEEHLAYQEERFSQIMATGAYPRLREVNARTKEGPAPAVMELGPERLFEFGLAAMLDGLCAQLTAKKSR
jgi:AcrR family transcriptional regulator